MNQSYRLRLIMLACLLVVNGTFVAVAQESTEAIRPIIALTRENDIYAVSPVDGSATLLVNRDETLDAVLNEVVGNDRLRLSQMSPDEAHIAYTAPLYEILDTTFDANRLRLRNRTPRDVYLLNVHTGESRSITQQASDLPQIINSGRSVTYSHLTWSPDGGRLYYVTNIYPLRRSQIASRQIDYYDLATGETGTLIPDFSRSGVYNRSGIYRLYPVMDGLITLVLQGDIEFDVSLYALDGEMIEQVQVDIPNWRNGSIAVLNPLIYEEQEVVGIIDTGDTIFGNVRLLDVAIGENQVLSENDRLALTSRSGLNDGSNDTLYAVLDHPFELMSPWRIRAGDNLGSILATFMGYAQWDFRDDIAVAPDGSAVAYIDFETDQINVVNREGTRNLNFTASAIAWGAPLYTIVNIPG